MTYVITAPCEDLKDATCVEVCPVDCIHTTDADRQFFIDPDVCIDCEQCVAVCPVHAIYLDKDVPDEWQSYLKLNAGFYRKTKENSGMTIPIDSALQMIEASHREARELNIQISVAVVDEGGRLIAFGRMDKARPLSVDRAINKAYTAASFQLPTHELAGQAQQPWFASLVASSQGRVIAVGGALPVVENATVIGAVGISGGTADQDLQCCRAALAVAV